MNWENVSIRLPSSKTVGRFLGDSWLMIDMGEPRSVWVVSSFGPRFLGCIRCKTKKIMGSKPINIIPPQLLLEFLPPVFWRYSTPQPLLLPCCQSSHTFHQTLRFCKSIILFWRLVSFKFPSWINAHRPHVESLTVLTIESKLFSSTLAWSSYRP